MHRCIKRSIPACSGFRASKISGKAGIAQLVEQRFCKPLVVGSIPTAGTAIASFGRIDILGSDVSKRGVDSMRSLQGALHAFARVVARDLRAGTSRS